MTTMATPRLSASGIGWIVAVLSLAIDQISKHWVLGTLHLVEGGEAVSLAPFAELRLVWNHGISYGLLQQGTDLGRWLLVGISVSAAVGLAIWLGRTASWLVAASVGLILAGAIGNAIDRTIYGAVIDFIYLFSPDRSFKWFVFNIADATIVAGVVGLLYDSLFSSRNT